MKPIVVINKLDKTDQRADEVLNETFRFVVKFRCKRRINLFPVYMQVEEQVGASKDDNGPREDI